MTVSVGSILTTLVSSSTMAGVWVIKVCDVEGVNDEVGVIVSTICDQLCENVHSSHLSN